MRHLWTAAGLFAVTLGAIGVLLPIVPTVPFLIVAAFCFARSNPAWEARLMGHPIYGPHLVAWRERGAVSRWAKIGASLAFAGSIAGGFYLLDPPWVWLPPVVAVLCLGWLWTRPEM